MSRENLHFIISSLSTDEIKAARAKAGILGTHYILAPGSISINGNIYSYVWSHLMQLLIFFLHCVDVSYLF